MVKLKGKLSELFCCCGTKFDIEMVVSERCLIIELSRKPSEMYCCCGTFRGIQSE